MSPSTTLTDQMPSYVQAFTATRNNWQAIYNAIPSSDDSGICGEIDNRINGEDFDAQVQIEANPDQIETLIKASIKSNIPLTYGVIRRLLCDCGKAGCCIREAK